MARCSAVTRRVVRDTVTRALKMPRLDRLVMVPGLRAASAPAISAGGRRRPTGRQALIAGSVVLAIALAGYFTFIAMHPMVRWMSPVDLQVYRTGGEIAARDAPGYLRLAAPLYGWPGTGLKFTYTPFAALVFTVLTVPTWSVLLKISIGANIAALVAAIWATLGGLGYRPGMLRLGATLLIAGAVFWTEPVQRTLYLGQIELLLVALIMWDMCQPDRHRWKGVGVGIAAGIKLVPLIFIPYLLLTRRFRQAGVATGTFAGTVAVGFAVLPADSRDWWLDGLFLKGSRTGFVGWEGNQSLQALITRLAGSIAAGQPIWLAAAAVTLVVGLAAAALMDRAGHPVIGLLTCALTGLLVSPISWDHHWVWIAPAVAVLAVYGVRARGALRWAYLTGAGLIIGLFGAWPGFLWGQPLDLGGFSMGFIWVPPNTNPGTFAKLGDRPWYVEYHWRGFELITGNLYVLTGLALFVLLAALAGRIAWRRRRLDRGRARSAAAAKPASAVSR
jgi:alpha-1,2-mannosyltransferase